MSVVVVVVVVVTELIVIFRIVCTIELVQCITRCVK